MENGFYWVKYDKEWTVAMKGDEGWYLPCCEYTMEAAGYGALEEIGEKIVRSVDYNVIPSTFIANIEGKEYIAFERMPITRHIEFELYKKADMPHVVLHKLKILH